MKYEEKTLEDMMYLYDKTKGYTCIGDYGEYFIPKTVEMIRKITSEDGWNIVKVINPDRHKTDGYQRDYYFISDKYKVFVGVSQHLWDNGEFVNYTKRLTGEETIYIVNCVFIGKNNGKKWKYTFRVQAANATQAKKRALEKYDEITKKATAFFPKDEYDIKIIDARHEA
jgi:hypothetical protein